MEVKGLTLFELNNLVKGVLKKSFADMYWVRAETSDVRVNQNGHCYLEFIEKDKSGKSVIAKSRAMVWANTFHLLRAYFEQQTGQQFTSGLKVMVQVSIEYHEVFGFSLTVHDIDPAYTLGDQALNRAAILKQLEEEGVLTLNKELVMTELPNRVAIISSPTAAGYEDFCNQLYNNEQGFSFYTKLFPAIMQGDRAESSIIAALDQIYQYSDLFDAVVIIRGGGATSELSCFDSYELAVNCAQFPLPIITGIGHERDETVLDIVAHTRAKTPTAVAEFLIGRMQDAAGELILLQQQITQQVSKRMQGELMALSRYETECVYRMKNWAKEQSTKLANMSGALKKAVQLKLKNDVAILNVYSSHLKLVSPDAVLKRGYSLTSLNGKVIKSIAQLKSGDCITTQFKDGNIKSKVEK